MLIFLSFSCLSPYEIKCPHYDYADTAMAYMRYFINAPSYDPFKKRKWISNDNKNRSSA